MKRSWIALILMMVASPAAAQRAGTLVSATPAVNAPPGMQAWRISYWTTDEWDRPQTVTGMVVAPPGPPASALRDVIAWTHGTWGVTEHCAPSLSPDFFRYTAGLAAAIASGRVVVAPDYPGLGSAMPHPYLVGEPTARSVLDAVRAARQIPGAAAGRRFAVWGESQGGHAALWTGLTAARYAPDLQLVGVAAAAPPTELAANFRLATDPSAKAFLTGFTAYAWSGHYGVPLTLGKKGTPLLVRRMAQKCISVNATPKLGTIIGILRLRGDLRGYDFAAQQPWSRYVTINSVQPTSSVPVIIAQTEKDPLVNPAVTRQFAQNLCATGARVRWINLSGGDHSTTAAQSATPTLQWIDDRFAGRPAQSDCGTI